MTGSGCRLPQPRRDLHNLPRRHVSGFGRALLRQFKSPAPPRRWLLLPSPRSLPVGDTGVQLSLPVGGAGRSLAYAVQHRRCHPRQEFSAHVNCRGMGMLARYGGRGSRAVEWLMLSRPGLCLDPAPHMVSCTPKGPGDQRVAPLEDARALKGMAHLADAQVRSLPVHLCIAPACVDSPPSRKIARSREPPSYWDARCQKVQATAW